MKEEAADLFSAGFPGVSAPTTRDQHKFCALNNAHSAHADEAAYRETCWLERGDAQSAGPMTHDE